MGLSGCGSSGETAAQLGSQVVTVAEVSPPEEIQALRQVLEKYQPQVKILSPQADEVLSSNRVAVRLRVEDLPLFKNASLELGPHLHVFLDDQPYQAVYDASQPVVFENLTPGSHSIRVFASRPWHESFKNEGAFAQVDFHVLTPTHSNQVINGQPLLTYSRPQGTYGAEPVMLDYYLSNVPLPGKLSENPADLLENWRIRVTVNGGSFELQEWQPIYLSGLKTGQNWIKLELLDKRGQLIPNAFNEQVRVFEVQPRGNDSLSRLVRGELTAAQAQGIVDPDYRESPVEAVTPDQVSTPTSAIQKSQEQARDRSSLSVPEPPSVPELVPPNRQPAPSKLDELVEPQDQESVADTAEEEVQLTRETLPEAVPSRPTKGWFGRFRSAPAVVPEPADEQRPTPAEINSAPESVDLEVPVFKLEESPLSDHLEPDEDAAAPEEVLTPPTEPVEGEPSGLKAGFQNLWNRFHQTGSETVSSPSVLSSEADRTLEAPSPEIIVEDNPQMQPLSPLSPIESDRLPAQETEGTDAPESDAAVSPWQGLLKRFQPKSELVPDQIIEETSPMPELNSMPEPRVEADSVNQQAERLVPTPKAETPQETSSERGINLDDLLQTQEIDLDNPTLVTPSAPPKIPSRYLKKPKVSAPNQVDPL
nr:DUF6130 family protein [Petrachloros mirabilis]